MREWVSRALSAGFYVCLALAVTWISFLLSQRYGGGLPIFGAILGAILMVYWRLQTKLKSTSKMLESIVGPGTGTMGDSSSPYNTDSLLNRFSVILEENGLSWLRASDLLEGLRVRLEELIVLQALRVDREVSSTGEEFDDNSRRDTEEEEEVSDGDQ